MAIADIVNYEGAFDLELVTPDGEKMGWTWHVMSAGSAKVKKAANRFKAEAHAKNMGKRKVKSRARLDVEEIISEMDIAAPRVIELVAATVSGWTVSDELTKAHKGENFDFTHENVVRFLGEEWIYDQVDESASDITNFT